MLERNRIAARGHRRMFLGGLVASGLVLPSALLAQVRGKRKANKVRGPKSGPAMSGAMAANGLADCLAACEAEYHACRQGVSRSRRSAVWKAALGYPACMASWIACQTACEAEAIGDALSDAADWIASHPEVVVGTIVVIGGVTFIVVATGGSGLGLAPVLALAL